MVKFTATWKNGRTLLGLGLSHNNLDKLRSDGTNGFINIDGEQMGLPFDVIITAAATEQILAEHFAEFVGPDTEVLISDKLKS